jgi:hypothetical protein
MAIATPDHLNLASDLLIPCASPLTVSLNQVCSQGDPESAVCVQLSFDSRNSAIHNAYRILRRPSSLFEPRHPSPKVVRNFLKQSEFEIEKKG